MSDIASDLIIDGGHIVTMDETRTVFEDGGILVRDGRIAAVGRRVTEQRTAAPPRRIDARGKLVIPGLINLHSHTAYTVLRGIAEDRGTASLYELLFPIMSLFTPSNVAAFSRLGMIENVKAGATTVVESTSHAEAIAGVVSDIGLRCVLAEYVTDIEMEPDGIGWSRSVAGGEETLARAEGFVETWHGRADGRITCMVAPTGPDSCSEEILRRSREVAERHGVYLTTHVGGDLEQIAIVKKKSGGLTPMGLLHENGITGPDLVAAHCVHLSDEDRRIIVDSGTRVSHNPSINAKRGKAAPLRDLRDRGVVVGLGSDNMHGNMAEVIKVAVLVNRVREHDGTYLQPADVLELATIRGAQAIGREHELGSLEPGKLADIVIIDTERAHLQPTVDPLASFVHNGLASDIDTVLVQGREVVRNGRVVGVDERAAIAEARAAAPEVWHGLGLR